jgi:Fur family transcriptional regulator, iron response regulator
LPCRVGNTPKLAGKDGGTAGYGHAIAAEGRETGCFHLRCGCIQQADFVYVANETDLAGSDRGWLFRLEKKMSSTRTVVIPNIKVGPERSPDRSALTGCPWHDVKAMLREVGLRPTRQRMALGWILFGKGDRHLTAEMLYEEATRAKVPVSLATIYNTLHQFTEVGLLRQVAVDGTKAYFDTNVTAHHHFFVEGEDELLDIPDAEVLVGKTPTPPEGFEIARIDVVVRLRRKS